MLTTELPFAVLDKHVILKSITGSTSYGLNTKNSDQDEKAIVRLPHEYIFQLGQLWETQTFHNPDMEFHDVKKFLTLANKQNPTILEILNTLQRFILQETEHGKILRDYRDIFLSSNCYQTFGGYARKQLLDIKNGLDKSDLTDVQEYLRIRINELLETFTERYDFFKGQISLSSIDIVDDSLEMFINANFQNMNLKQANAMFSEMNNTYKGISKMNQRNRRDNEQQLLKHAMHLIRLLIMGIEVLETGKVNVFREKDREFLLSIRQGKYSWEEIFEMAESLFNDLERAFHRTVLPPETDIQKVNKLYLDIMAS